MKELLRYAEVYEELKPLQEKLNTFKFKNVGSSSGKSMKVISGVFIWPSASLRKLCLMESLQ